ncbi:MAG: ABC transporter permease [Planctomycetota bacterium]
MTARRDADGGGSRMRVAGLVRKECWQIVRDPSSIAIAFGMPALLLLLFGFGVSLDAENVPVALVVDEPTAQAGRFAGALDGSRYFDLRRPVTMPEAIAMMEDGTVEGIVHLRDDFSARTRRPGGAPVQVILNGTDANRARLLQGYLQGAWQLWVADELRSRGRAFRPPVAIETQVWFNPEVRSRNFLVPGLVAIIMTLIGALLTALVVAREWQRGTMEALLVTPVRVRELLLGKLLPYFALGLGGLGVSVAMAVWVFDVPLRGSLGILLVTSSVFLLAALGMGLLISTLTKDQFVAAQVALLATFLPAFILSGFVFDLASAPWAIRLISRAVAARYYVSILHTVFLAGDVPRVLMANTLALAVLAVIFLGLSRLLSRKRLE